MYIPLDSSPFTLPQKCMITNKNFQHYYFFLPPYCDKEYGGKYCAERGRTRQSLIWEADKGKCFECNLHLTNNSCLQTSCHILQTIFLTCFCHTTNTQPRLVSWRSRTQEAYNTSHDSTGLTRQPSRDWCSALKDANVNFSSLQRGGVNQNSNPFSSSLIMNKTICPWMNYINPMSSLLARILSLH